MTLQGQWRWGPDWDEAVRETPEGDEGFGGMKYADLALYCGEEVIIPLRLDHYNAEWDVDHATLDKPSAEKRTFIVRACNAHEDAMAACKALAEWDHMEKTAPPYDSDGGAHWNARLRKCEEAFDLARAALAKAERE